MRLSQKKIALYGFLLFAAIMGLVIDRLYTPQSANAAIGGTRDRVRTPTGTDAEELGDIPPVAAIFDPSRSTAASSAHALKSATKVLKRDAFGLSAGMREVYQRKTAVVDQGRQSAKQRKAEQARDAADAFATSHRLEGTLLHPTDTRAVVDGRLLRIGDQLDGFELRRIERYRALFSKDGKDFELKLPNPLNTKVGVGNKR